MPQINNKDYSQRLSPVRRRMHEGIVKAKSLTPSQFVVHDTKTSAIILERDLERQLKTMARVGWPSVWFNDSPLRDYGEEGITKHATLKNIQ
jgi:hypothetical protein